METEIEKNGKCLLLAYDHGLEHGPKDFNERSVSPEEILGIAEKGPFTGIILQKGIAEKYHGSLEVPLVLKMNGKTALNPRNYSEVNCSFERAMELGAEAVGFTLYPGSEYESKMQERFRKIQEKAVKEGIPTILWSYPRGQGIDETSLSIIAYAARISLELGADYTKVKYPGLGKDFRWVVRNADKTKVLCSGGEIESEKEFLDQVRDVMNSGAAGLAVGRNIWQRDNPLEMSRKVSKIVFGPRD